ncbi:hypothetical protein RF11_14465 [Thelohanellus kitauei]|uniref:Uncharacterized protein n=1 Tax=Thelohanellus kitauei TaxID=669202 RepID=A0A0C2M4U6_THEKT|nr:hypothetical protein RF11_14465 [Thelohanellus kitauei]
MPRNDLTLPSKIKIQTLNTSYHRLAEITGVPKSTISRVFRQESQLPEESGKDLDVEEAMDQWFSIVSGKGVNINGPILKAKSEELTKKLGRNDFKTTDDGSLCYKHISPFGYNKEMDRTTVLCCTNMSGTDKRKPLIIGKSARTRCFGAKNVGFSSGVPIKQKCMDDFRNFSKLTY